MSSGNRESHNLRDFDSRPIKPSPLDIFIQAELDATRAGLRTTTISGCVSDSDRTTFSVIPDVLQTAPYRGSIAHAFPPPFTSQARRFRAVRLAAEVRRQEFFIAEAALSDNAIIGRHVLGQQLEWLAHSSARRCIRIVPDSIPVLPDPELIIFGEAVAFWGNRKHKEADTKKALERASTLREEAALSVRESRKLLLARIATLRWTFLI